VVRRLAVGNRGRARSLRLLGIGLVGLLLACEGDGSGGEGLIIRNDPDPGCAPAGRDFPSGLAVLSPEVSRAALVQTRPPDVRVYGLDADAPTLLSVVNIGLDSDGDGIPDTEAIEPILGPFRSPVMGEIQAVSDEIALVSTSDYEQVLVVDPRTGRPVEVTIEVPSGIPPGRHPLLPAPGTSATRTGLSTLACVSPPDPVDSEGDPIGVEPACSADAPSFLTTLTAGKAVVGGRLFVATSNLIPRTSRYAPGTVLVFDWEEGPNGIVVRPSVDTPMLWTSVFNPTGLVAFRTPGGRELALVTGTGAIGFGSGASNIRTESAIDVIDPSVPRIVASIPLGLAGPSFDAPAVEPGGRLAFLGASSQRRIYAIDLRALDTPALHARSGPPVVLDGMTLGFEDARVFTADRPLELPRRGDGRASGACEGNTDVTTNALGTQAFVTDFCDGTLTRLRFDLEGSPPVPYAPERFSIAGQSSPFAPNDDFGQLSAPGLVLARPGIPGVDFTSPDLLVLAGQPNAQLCAFRIESDRD